jgi:hypothetical protein
MPLCFLEEKEKIIPDFASTPFWITNLRWVGVL